jgi:hypothetical protein
MLALALLILGCAKEPPDLKAMGIWTGNPPLPKDVLADPTMADMVKALEGSLSLHIKSNHTYRLDCWGVKEGKWKLANNLVLMEETSSRSIMSAIFGNGPDLGSVNAEGKRSYSAVLSQDGKTLTFLMGKLGDVEFKR